MEPKDVHFFESPEAFGDWLAEHHRDASELWVGLYKRSSGRPSLTWAQSVEQALRFGWIDGIRQSVDEEGYAIRFTPRKRGSTWSRVNAGTARELIAQGLMAPAGLAAFEARADANTGIYTYEQPAAALDPDAEAHFRANPAAWSWWMTQTPSYRRTATRWVLDAKQAATRERRLDSLIDDCAAGRPIKPLRFGRDRTAPRRDAPPG